MYKLTNTGQEVQDALNAVLEKSAGGHLKEATTSSSGLMSAADKQRLRDQEGEIDAIDQATQRAQAKAEAAFTRAGEAMTHSINLSEKRVNGQQLKYGVDLTGEDIPVNPVTKDTVAQALGKRVEITLRINGKQLNEDVTLTASDIDAGGKSIMDRLQDLIAGKVDNTIRINNYVLNKSVNLSAQDINLTKDSGKSIYDFIMALDTNKVNKTTAINGQPLTGNVTLTGEDIPSLAIQDYPTVDEALHRLDGDKADKTELNAKADLNPQGALATGQEQRLVVTFINTGCEIVTPTVAGVYYNGQTKKVETYEEQGSATVSKVVKVLSETPSQNVVYCDKAENKLYRWDGSKMVQLSSGGGDSYTKAETDALLAGKASATSQMQMDYEEEPVEVDTNSAILFMSAGINNHIHDTDEALATKADKDGFKTINGESIVGSGDITIDGGGVDVVQTTGQSTTAVMSQKAVTEAINKPIESNTASVVTLSATKVLDLGSRGAFEVRINNADPTAEYEFTFVGGSGVSVTFPSGIDLGGFAPSEGKKYDCIIYNSKLYYYEW